MRQRRGRPSRPCLPNPVKVLAVHPANPGATDAWLLPGVPTTDEAALRGYLTPRTATWWSWGQLRPVLTARSDDSQPAARTRKLRSCHAASRPPLAPWSGRTDAHAKLLEAIASALTGVAVHYRVPPHSDWIGSPTFSPSARWLRRNATNLRLRPVRPLVRRRRNRRSEKINMSCELRSYIL